MLDYLRGKVGMDCGRWKVDWMLKNRLLPSSGYLLILTSPAMLDGDVVAASAHWEAPTVYVERIHVPLCYMRVMLCYACMLCMLTLPMEHY